jgi:hypothetical protein
MISGTSAQVSTLLRVVEALFRGVNVLGSRLADLALERGHQRGGLARHKGPGAARHLDVKGETAPQYVVTQQPVIAGLIDG